MVSSMFLTVSRERRDHILVGAELDDLAELLQRDVLGFLHLLGAFVQRVLAFGGQQRRSLAGEARALGGKLQAGGQARDVAGRSDRPCARRDGRAPWPAPALMTRAMPAITAKAANRLPLTPHRGRKKPMSLPSLPIARSPRHVVPARTVPWDGSFGRQYRVTRLIKSGRFTGFAPISAVPKTQQKGRREAGLSEAAIRSTEISNVATTGPPQLKR